MKRYYLLLPFFILYCTASFSQTPGAYLGYEVGSRFTYHHRMLDYIKLMAEKHKDRVRLIEYGTTYEGRPLVAVVLGNVSNISQLENIRQNQLQGIGLLEGQAQESESAPAIAWLSYNVHGDEAVSLEAAMEVMYELLEGETKKILEDLIVIIDPCLNPDGHNRYVGWYNQVKGVRPDPSPIAREHDQPWPGGRFNHYLFDLNRDWAWQVQRESQLRVALYNQWMPHLHADFHEMGANSSYYFPPAAHPYHESITPWQREFNQILGEFNRKYFDANRWLYFTRTSYDLFYPSYGDTWPTFNGAIGVTYEQGGGGRAGLALARPELGDTLTLKTRIAHHVTASKATLEALAANRSRVKKEFVNYFKNASLNPAGKYKMYIVKPLGKPDRLLPLEEMLRKQQIVFGRAGEVFSTQATDLSDGKTAKTSFEAGDLVISAYQAKSHLVKVLFEPNPLLEDSLTYDITSWGLGYVFGVKVFGLDQKRDPADKNEIEILNKNTTGGAYAYVVNWETAAQVRFLSDLLTHNFKIRTAETDFEIEGGKFSAGALLITKAGNEAIGSRFEDLVRKLANKHQIKLTPVKTGMVSSGPDFGSSQVSVLSFSRVGVVSGDGISPTAFGAIWHFFDQELGYPVTVFGNDNLNADLLGKMDVLILPDGNYSLILKEDQLGMLSEWVAKGGKLIAMERALHAFVGKKEFALKRKSEGRGGNNPLRTYASQSRESIRSESAGGIFEVTLDSSHPLGFGYKEIPYYSSVREAYELDYLSDGWNVGYLGADNYRSGFVGDKAKSKLKHTLLFGVEEKGRGKVIYMADNPLFRGFWENGKVLFGNAVFR